MATAPQKTTNPDYEDETRFSGGEISQGEDPIAANENANELGQGGPASPIAKTTPGDAEGEPEDMEGEGDLYKGATPGDSRDMSEIYRNMLKTPATNQISFITPIPWMEREMAVDRLVRIKQEDAMKIISNILEQRHEEMRKMLERARILDAGLDDAMRAKLAFRPSRPAADLLQSIIPKQLERRHESTKGIMSALLLRDMGSTHLASIATWSGQRIDTVDGGRLDFSQDKVSIRKVTQQSIDIMVAEARERGWSSIKASGSHEFCQALARTAASQGIAVDAQPTGIMGIPMGRRIRVSAQAILAKRPAGAQAPEDKPRKEKKAPVEGRIEQGEDIQMTPQEEIPASTPQGSIPAPGYSVSGREVQKSRPESESSESALKQQGLEQKEESPSETLDSSDDLETRNDGLREFMARQKEKRERIRANKERLEAPEPKAHDLSDDMGIENGPRPS